MRRNLFGKTSVVAKSSTAQRNRRKGLFAFRRSHCGFTLTELLVGLVTSSIFLAATSGIIIEVMRQERRESAKIDTQNELQLALDYIRRDLQEAVFVYSGQELQDELIANNRINTSDTPVLAFWKLSDADECEGSATAACTTDPGGQNIGNLALTGNKYVLIAYYWQTNVSSTTWSADQFGPARITRLELGPFESGGTPTQRADYRAFDPLIPIGWPYESSYGTLPAFNSTLSPRQVLTAFVDSNEVVPAPAAINCPAGYNPTPNVSGAPSAANAYYAFFACVSDQAKNQDVIVYLRGNGLARADGTASASDLALFPQLETTVFARGAFGLN